jgi:hypothetical protein
VVTLTTAKEFTLRFYKDAPTMSMLPFDEAGYIMECSLGDFLMICGCAYADICNPAFDSEDTDVSVHKYAYWVQCVLMQWRNNRDSLLNAHTAIAGAHPFKDLYADLGSRTPETEPDIILVHKTMLIDFAEYYGLTVPVRLQRFIQGAQTAIESERVRFRSPAWYQQKAQAEMQNWRNGGLASAPKTKRKVDVEVWYRDTLQALVGGECEVKLSPKDIADVVTDTVIYEVKAMRNWERAIGQLARYQSHAPSKTKAMVLFGTTKKITIEEIATIAATTNVAVYHMSDDAVLTRICPA